LAVEILWKVYWLKRMRKSSISFHQVNRLIEQLSWLRRCAQNKR